MSGSRGVFTLPEASLAGRMVERSCVVCRKTGTKGHLIRFGLTSVSEQLFEVRIDPPQRLMTRGAYCHPECLRSRKLEEALERTLGRGSKGRKIRRRGDAEVLKELEESLPLFAEELRQATERVLKRPQVRGLRL